MIRQMMDNKQNVCIGMFITIAYKCETLDQMHITMIELLTLIMDECKAN